MRSSEIATYGPSSGSACQGSRSWREEKIGSRYENTVRRTIPRDSQAGDRGPRAGGDDGLEESEEEHDESDGGAEEEVARGDRIADDVDQREQGLQKRSLVSQLRRTSGWTKPATHVICPRKDGLDENTVVLSVRELVAGRDDVGRETETDDG